MQKHTHEPYTDPGCSSDMVAIFALIRESGEDKRFEGDALDYRS